MLGSPDLGCGALPPWPQPGMGSPRLLLSSLWAPHRVHPLVIASACLPPGRADHTVLPAMMQGLETHAGQRQGPAVLTGLHPPSKGPAAGWAATGRTWI